jgi:hypothetical protein
MGSRRADSHLPMARGERRVGFAALACGTSAGARRNV